MTMVLDSGVLTLKERRILELYFGLGDNGNDNELTLTEIARKYGLTKQRIQQIRAEAFRKLRRHRFARELSSFL